MTYFNPTTGELVSERNINRLSPETRQNLMTVGTSSPENQSSIEQGNNPLRGSTQPSPTPQRITTSRSKKAALLTVTILSILLFLAGAGYFYMTHFMDNSNAVVNAVAVNNIIPGTYRPHLNGKKDMSREMIITEPGENQFLMEIVSDEDPLQHCFFEIDSNGKLLSTELGVGTVEESKYNEVIITFTDSNNNVLKLVRIKK